MDVYLLDELLLIRNRYFNKQKSQLCISRAGMKKKSGEIIIKKVRRANCLVTMITMSIIDTIFVFFHHIDLYNTYYKYLHKHIWLDILPLVMCFVS